MKQRESLFDFLERGIYTKEIFIERSNALEQRIRDCMNNITAAREDLHTTIARQANSQKFCPEVQELVKRMELPDYPGKEQRFKETDRPDCTDQNKTE